MRSKESDGREMESMAGLGRCKFGAIEMDGQGGGAFIDE